MGLLTILKKLKAKEREMRFLVLGLDNAGKSTIVKKFCGEDIDSVAPTFGFAIVTLEHRGYKLNIWDVGGQKSLRTYWRNYFEETEAVIWVIDSSDRMRMDDCKKELHNLLLTERLWGASLLIFANKQDVPGAMSVKDIEDALDLKLIDTHMYKIFPCSAVTGENLLEGMDWLVKDVGTRLYRFT